MRRSRWIPTTACLVAMLFLAGCGPIRSVTIGQRGHHHAHSKRDHGHGPPPHAPAHGHRHKQRHHGEDIELVFDSEMGIYVVVDVPNHYYFDGHYLRVEGDRWYSSTTLHGRYEPRAADWMPPGQAKKKGRAKKHGKKDKSYPAKKKR